MGETANWAGLDASRRTRLPSSTHRAPSAKRQAAAAPFAGAPDLCEPVKSVNDSRPARRSSLAAFLLAIALIAGCAPARQSGPRLGPTAPVAVRVEPGAFDGKPARRLVTPHYLIDTTIEDADFVATLPQLMEGALAQYRRLAPGVPPSAAPMRCNVFATRAQWATFTEANAGDDAAVYLQINRGGYAINDWYVAYFIGDLGTWSVAAHEGWHQFVARHFQRRPPPFLEEGLACLFEDVQWEADLPRWHLSVNPARLTGLRRTIERDALIPLDALCTMHAGQIVNTAPARIEGFYAQGWAFARFLWDGQQGRYRPALQRMLADLAAGKAEGPGQAASGNGVLWDPASAKPLLERYLGKPLGEIDGEYQAFMRRAVDASPAFQND